MEPRLFSFNAPQGACPVCSGLGQKLEFDPDLVIPDPSLSFDEGGCIPYNPDAAWNRSRFEALAKHFKFSLDTAFEDLPKKVLDAILHGTDEAVKIRYENREGTGRFEYESRFPGILADLKRRYLETQSEGIKHWLERFMSEKPCEACGGRRLRPEALAVTVGGIGIDDLSGKSVEETLAFIAQLSLERHREADRQADPEGDQRAAQLHAQRRPRVPYPRAQGRDPLRRRGPAHHAWRRRSAPRSSASSTSSTSPRSACISGTTSASSTRSPTSATSATR